MGDNPRPNWYVTLDEMQCIQVIFVVAESFCHSRDQSDLDT
jgi:hypothetical protein